jgi:hypothetical protein
MEPLRRSLQAAQRVCRARVKPATKDNSRYRATPSLWKAKTAVIVDAAPIRSQPNALQIFLYGDAQW